MTRSKILQQILDETPLDTTLKVQNQIAFIDLITKLGYRESKMWRDEDPEDERVLKIITELAREHTSYQMRSVNEVIEPLRELLAVLHGDGGHYTAEHGLVKSIKDAQDLLHKKWIRDENSQ